MEDTPLIPDEKIIRLSALTEPDPDLIDSSDVLIRFGIKYSTVKRMVKAGVITKYKFGKYQQSATSYSILEIKSVLKKMKRNKGVLYI